ncbi:MAG: 16S rRNA (cytosine(1402)-N(4))-methyltransferase RsmH [Rhodospirillales bacterium]
MSRPADKHIPVLLSEVVQGLAVNAGGVYVDGTFGYGGYTQAILSAADCRVVAFDRDPAAIAGGQDIVAEAAGRLDLVHACFSTMAEHLAPGSVDGVALDIGVSSMQIDEADRGFSFRQNGPLDMRMSSDGETAADIVNLTGEKELARIIYEFGEEKASRRVASAIVARRRERKFEMTGDLASVVRSVVRASKDGIDPATRTFQGLRIAVNDELGELDRGLLAAERILKPGGRLAVVSFHSLEDRRVKHFLRDRSGENAGSRHLPAPVSQRVPSFTLVSRKAVVPGEDETRRNPRARSARLRIAERTDAPVPEAGS